jgi:hypothetical protein
VCSQHLLHVIYRVWNAGDGAVIFNADQQISSVCIGEGNQGFSDVAAYVCPPARTFLSRSSCIGCLKLAEMAFVQLYRIANALSQDEWIHDAPGVMSQPKDLRRTRIVTTRLSVRFSLSSVLSGSARDSATAGVSVAAKDEARACVRSRWAVLNDLAGGRDRFATKLGFRFGTRATDEFWYLRDRSV